MIIFLYSAGPVGASISRFPRQIVERQVADGRYPDAESAVTAAVMMLEDAGMNWGEVDAAAVRGLIAVSDAEGGEIPFEEVARRLAGKSAKHQR